MRQMAKYDAVTYALNALIPTIRMPDTDATRLKGYFPAWDSLIGAKARKGMRVRYKGALYRVMQDHDFSRAWEPGPGTESLYERIPEEYEGTEDDPVEYTGNMRLEIGKYYVQDGVTYLCVRDSGIPVYDTLATLATEAGGNFVVAATPSGGTSVPSGQKDGYRIIPEAIAPGLSFGKGERGWWKDQLYESQIPANVYTPEQYPQGWKKVEA